MQVPGSGITFDLPRHSVCAEYCQGTFRNVLDIFDKPRSLRAKVINDMLVVDDFVPDIDRRAVLFECAFDDFNCPDNAGTKSPGVCNHYPDRFFVIRSHYSIPERGEAAAGQNSNGPMVEHWLCSSPTRLGNCLPFCFPSADALALPHLREQRLRVE